MEKHKIEVAMMMYHPGGKAYNGIEVAYINDPSIEWTLIHMGIVLQRT